MFYRPSAKLSYYLGFFWGENKFKKINVLQPVLVGNHVKMGYMATQHELH